MYLSCSDCMAGVAISSGECGSRSRATPSWRPSSWIRVAGSSYHWLETFGSGVCSEIHECYVTSWHAYCYQLFSRSKSTTQRIVSVFGNSGVAVAWALHYYLRTYTSSLIAWESVQLVLPQPLPAVKDDTDALELIANDQLVTFTYLLDSLHKTYHM